MKHLAETARRMLADHKGLLAMDESNGTCDKRFAKAGIPQTEEARRRYRELIITTPDLAECISGVILYDETIRQARADGPLFVRVIAGLGIIPGIKVDMGAKDLAGHAGEKITEGLDGLRERLQDYFEMGARFAKWRAVIGPRRRTPKPRVHRRQCARACPIRRPLSGGRSRSDRRAGGADGGRSYVARCLARRPRQVLRAVFDQLAI